jgi:hypothetical protein
VQIVSFFKAAWFVMNWCEIKDARRSDTDGVSEDMISFNCVIL